MREGLTFIFIGVAFLSAHAGSDSEYCKEQFELAVCRAGEKFINSVGDITGELSSSEILSITEYCSSGKAERSYAWKITDIEGIPDKTRQQRPLAERIQPMLAQAVDSVLRHRLRWNRLEYAAPGFKCYITERAREILPYVIDDILMRLTYRNTIAEINKDIQYLNLGNRS